MFDLLVWVQAQEVLQRVRLGGLLVVDQFEDAVRANPQWVCPQWALAASAVLARLSDDRADCLHLTHLFFFRDEHGVGHLV